MYFEGKKYACDACVRGHRVSGCNHNDRPLQEIAKKGRPVSQCQHCRTMRKSRAAHVKCDCGDKAKGPVKHHYINENGKLVEMPEASETSEAKESTGHCRCSSGASRCVCSIKKEILDAVPELASTPRSSLPKKPSLQATQSETSLTKFANGYHRPIHRHNSHHGTAPYHIPHHGTHANSTLLSDMLAEADRPMNHAIRSMTSDSIPAAIALQHPPTRLVKSEHNSPGLKPLTFAQSAGVSGTTTPIKDQMSPAALLRSISDFNLSSAGLRHAPELSLRTDFSAFEPTDYPSQEYFMSAASEYPVPPNTAVWPSDAHHHFDSLFEMAPDLTQSLSGDDSEVGDFGLSAGLSPVHNLSPGIMSGGPLSPESSEVCDSDGYGISAQSSILNMASLALPPTGNEIPNMESYLGGNPLEFGAFDHNALGGQIDDGKASGMSSYCNSVRNSLQFQDGDVLMMPLVPSQNLPKFEFRQ